MKFRLLIVLTILLFGCQAQAKNGMVSVKSAFDVEVTRSNLIAALQAKGMTIFAHVEHSKSAEGVGVSLRPMELVVFGNPKVGSPLMACSQTVGIDLPQKALIYEDEKGVTWLSYNDPAYLVDRHDISGCEGVVEKISQALSNFSKKATQR